MPHQSLVLLAHDHSRILESLRFALDDLSVETHSVHTCSELARVISHRNPRLVFTDTSLPDGTWADVIGIVEKRVPTNVVVVGAHDDIGLYLSVLDRGAFDFIIPPFEREALNFVVKSAASDALGRRTPPLARRGVMQSHYLLASA